MILRYWCVTWDKITTVLQLQMKCFPNTMVTKVRSKSFYLQKYERGEVQTGSLNSFHASLSEIIVSHNTSWRVGHFKLFKLFTPYMRKPVLTSNADIGRPDQTKRWMTTHCWDGEEVWRHEKCLGGIRRHFWFGMVRKCMWCQCLLSEMKEHVRPLQCLFAIFAIIEITVVQVVFLLAGAWTVNVDSCITTWQSSAK